MTARDDYPLLADFADRPSGRDRALIAKRIEARLALDEIDHLRAAVAQLQADLGPGCTMAELRAHAEQAREARKVDL